MGKLIINTLVYTEISDKQLDGLRSTIGAMLENDPNGTWLYLEGGEGSTNNVVLINSTSQIRMEYDGEPVLDPSVKLGPIFEE